MIECELQEISTDGELNFTLSSRGRATVGTNTSYSCNSKRYELTDGTEVSTCTSNGEWSSPTPNCSLIDTETTDPDQKSASSTAGYIGGGVGAGVVVILIVVVVLLLLRRRKSRTHQHRKTQESVTELAPTSAAGSQNPETCQTETSNNPNEADSTYETTRKGAVQHIYQPIRNAMKEMKDKDSSMRDPATRKGSVQHVYEPIRKEIAGVSTHHEQQEESNDYSYVLSNATAPILQPPTSSNDSSDDCNDYVGPDSNVRASTDSYIDVL